ncbi:MAG: hypothetical protein ACLFMX_02830 [Halobacteriales archaeon]
MSDDALPAGWELEYDRTVYDSVMDREYTRIGYRRPDTGQVLRIFDVQEPHRFGGWGYLVLARGPVATELGLVATIDEAKELAGAFMAEAEGA